MVRSSSPSSRGLIPRPVSASAALSSGCRIAFRGGSAGFKEVAYSNGWRASQLPRRFLGCFGSSMDFRFGCLVECPACRIPVRGSYAVKVPLPWALCSPVIRLEPVTVSKRDDLLRPVGDSRYRDRL